MKRTRSARKRNRMNGMRLFLTGVIVVLLVVFLLSVKNIIDLRQEQDQLKETNTVLQEQRAELETELKSVGEDSYIEEQARTQLNMVKPGEILYVLDQGDDEDDQKEETEKTDEN